MQSPSWGSGCDTAQQTHLTCLAAHCGLAPSTPLRCCCLTSATSLSLCLVPYLIDQVTSWLYGTATQGTFLPRAPQYGMNGA